MIGWPKSLWLVRHAESTGNVARDHAEASGAEVIDIEDRDIDVPLSARGEQQADALARLIATFSPAPTVALCSPQRRAMATAAPMSLAPIVDERLREKELGALDRLTRIGVAARYPAEVAARHRVGKFYYRAPGGESWCDVVQRVRGVWSDIQQQHAGAYVVIVSHQVVISSFRYLLERLSESQLLALEEVANASITTYGHDPLAGRMELRALNRTAS